MTEAAATGFVMCGLHARHDRSKDIRVVAIEHRIAGGVRLLGDLNGSGGGAVPLDGVADELRISRDVAGSGSILQDQIEQPPIDRIQLTALRGGDFRATWSGVVRERRIASDKERPRLRPLKIV